MIYLNRDLLDLKLLRTIRQQTFP